MVSRQVSGGDIYVATLIQSAGKKLDLATNTRALELLGGHKHNVLARSTDRLAGGIAGITLIYTYKALSTSIKLLLSNPHRKTVIAASPFVCDLIPACFARCDNRVVILFHLLPKREASSFTARLRFALARFEQSVMLRLIRWRFQTVLVGNDALRQEIQSRYPGKSVYVAHAGIDTGQVDRARVAKKDPNLALFVGRLTTQKGVLDLVDVAKAAHKKNADFRLKIVGDGPDKEHLRRRLSKEGVECVELMGFVDNEQKYSLLNKAQYFLFPSYEEGWGIALAEALYANCVCVCYELDHYRSLFSDFPKYVPVGDKKEFAQRLIKAMGARPSVGQREVVARYDHKIVTKGIVERLGLA